MSISNIEVRPVSIMGMAGFQIQCAWRACNDSFWETMAHAAVFQDRQRAEAFLARVKAKPSWEWDWQRWGKPADQLLSNLDYVQEHAPVYSVI